MTDLKRLAAIAITAFSSTTITLFSLPGKAANTIKVSCDRHEAIPTVTITLSKQDYSQTSSILSFLPKYFSLSEAENKCQSTAQKLQTLYSQGRMNYLASDTVGQKPVVCAVERRGLKCNSYGSQMLFSLNQPVNPTELLYDMLGDNFKGSRPPSSRTVNRIYTDLRPPWWPF